MHPIERLRYVARADGTGPTLLTREAANALLGFSDDPAGLVTACRRLIDRHAGCGPLWWLAARALCAGDPVAEIHRAADELAADLTDSVLAAHLPEGATVLVVGWPEQAAHALERRGDVAVLAASVAGEGDALARALSRAGCDAEGIPDAGVGAAAAASDLVLLEATALGPGGFVAAAGSHAAAAVAAHHGVPVWVVVGAGRVLPARLWTALTDRLDAADDPWEADIEVVPLDLATVAVGPAGPAPAADAPRRADAPIAPELLKGV